MLRAHLSDFGLSSQGSQPANTLISTTDNPTVQLAKASFPANFEKLKRLTTTIIQTCPSIRLIRAGTGYKTTMHYTVASTRHYELSYSLKPVGHTITVSKTRELCDSREFFEATGE